MAGQALFNKTFYTYLSNLMRVVDFMIKYQHGQTSANRT
jgi:hypothetical protein